MFLQNNELKKKESEIRAELETKLINVENDVVETSLREQQRHEENADLRKQYEV